MTVAEAKQRLWSIACHARECRLTLASIEESRFHIDALRAVDAKVPGYEEITRLALSTLNLRYDRQDIGIELTDNTGDTWKR